LYIQKTVIYKYIRIRGELDIGNEAEGASVGGMNLTFSEHCVVIYVCKKNQKNAHFFHQ